MAAQFFQQQLDYIYFFCGLSFMLLAAICAIKCKRRENHLPWVWLGLFGFVHGINEWSNVLAFVLEDGTDFMVISFVVMASSFLFLVEFGRDGLSRLQGKAPGRWIYLPLGACLCAGALAGLPGLMVSARYSLGLVGGILASLALYRASREDKTSGQILLYSAVFMALYAVASGIIVPQLPYFPASVVNVSSFFSFVGIPIQLVRGVLSIFLVALIWLYSRHSRQTGLAGDVRKSRIHNCLRLITVLLTVMVLGWIFTNYIGKKTDKEIRSGTLNQINMAAAVLNSELIQNLTGTTADLKHADYTRLRRQLMDMKRSNPQLRWLYVMFLREGKIKFVVDSIPEAEFGHTDPGVTYEWFPKELTAVFETGKSVTVGPYTDEYGSFISGFAAVRDHLTGRIIGVFGADINVSDWWKMIALARLEPICIILLVALLFAGTFVARQRMWESAQMIAIREKMLADAQKIARVGSWGLDLKTNKLTWSEQMYRVHGLASENIMPEFSDLQRFFHPEDWPKLQASIQKAKLGGEPDELELRIIRPDGEIRYILSKADFKTGKDGEKHMLMGTSQDITERKRSEDALRRSETRFRLLSHELEAILNGLPDSLAVISPDFKVLWANHVAAGLAGRESKMLIGMQCYELWHGTSAPCTFCPVQDCFKTGEKAELDIQTPDGRRIELRVVPVKDGNGKVIKVYEIERDVTEQRNLEKQLRHAQKMEAIGVLSGGIAHDFNNIINVIMGFAGFMKTRVDEGSFLSPHLQQILTAADKAKRLTSSLLTFSRKQTLDLKPVNLNDIVKEAEKLLRMLLREDIEITLKMDSVELPVMADSGLLEQVMVNITSNAVDVMPQGGSLIIETSTVSIDNEFIRVHGYGKAGKYAILSFSDTGVGMVEEIKQKIFEPFFTTKEVDKGTGLGLAIVYGIIKQHKGYINCYSEPGIGTTFRIYLPAINEVKEHAVVKSAAPSPGGTETVLLVEDDAQLRQMAEELLTWFGYQVIVAADGEEAVAKFIEHRESIQLTILDVILPKKNGKEVYREITKIKPGLRVLFTSGYPENVLDQNEILQIGTDFIGKPAIPNVFLSKIREILDR